MSLNNIIDEMEKDSSVTSEQLISTFYSKENLSLKTEIPFSTEVEITATIKDACILLGQLFNNVQIIDDDGKTNGNDKYTPMKFTVVTPKGESQQIKFGDMLTRRLTNEIDLSEEYAVSHKRKGRTEGAHMLGTKLEQSKKTSTGDTLSKVMNKQ